MKRIFLLLWILSISFQVSSQTPEKKNRALIYKTTATWCYPCGTWGWDLANALNADLGDDIVYLALFNSSNGNYNNSAFYNAVAVTLAFNFRHSSWPSFGVNGHNFSDVNRNQSSGIRKDCVDSAMAFKNSRVIVNAASDVSINPGGEISVTTKAVFFEATQGEYYLATYLVEEGAVNRQYGQNGLVEHKGVLRVAMDSLDWGSLISSDSVDAGFEIAKNYSYTVSNESWDLSKIAVYNIIWKRVGTKYEYVNGSIHNAGSTKVESSRSPSIHLEIYPNPITDMARIQLSGLESPAVVNITDLMGRKMESRQFSNSQEIWKLDVSGFPKGVYVVHLISDNVRIQRRVLIL